MKQEDLIMLMRMVDLQERLDTFTNEALRELQKTYKSLVRELMNVVSSKKTTYYSKRQAALLLEEVKSVTEVVAEQLSVPTAEAVGYAGEYSYTQMNKIVSWDYRVLGFNTVQLTASQIAQLVIDQPLNGKTLQQWMGSAFVDIDTILPEIQKGYVAGESYAKIVSRIDNALMGNQPKQHIESVVKTYIQSMNVKAQQDVYEANPEVVKRVEWSALMEKGNTKTGRGTCPRCMALDGQQWEVTDYSRPACPLHVRCRCVLSPITVTWDELGFATDKITNAYRPWTERAANGDLMEYGTTDMNYEEWWWSRNKTFQDNAIGPKRADLVRDGEIDFQNIVDDKGNLIPIRNLK